MRFYSQYQQDKIVFQEFFKNRQTGTFLEIGADDGVTFSNTKFFEESLGWSGICIEPRPNAYELLVNNRKCICENIAISNKNEIVDFLSIDGYGKGLSGIIDNYDPRHEKRVHGSETINSKKETIQVQCRPLEDVLLEHNMLEIDFCSLDVEGSEMKIIESIDFDKVNIKVFTIENNYNDNIIKDFLAKKGYKLFKRQHIDDIFVKI